jgi:hypothetical protein
MSNELIVDVISQGLGFGFGTGLVIFLCMWGSKLVINIIKGV